MQCRCGRAGRPARLFYIIPVIADSFGLQGGPRGADPMNWYYVKIALGNFFWRVFLFVGLGSSLVFLFYRFVLFSNEKEKAMCCMWAGTKSMTPIRFATGQAEKITEGLAQRKGKKDRGNFAKYLFNHSKIHFAKWLGFLPWGVWGHLASRRPRVSLIVGSL